MSEPLLQIHPNLAAVRDHARQFSDFTFVYPVISRRARGLSIGINLNPDKLCNFDCVYCEVDRRVPGKVSQVDLKQLRDELVAMVRFAKDGGLAKEPKFNQVPWLTRDIKDLAFSGDGEPTLLHNFAECVQVAADARLSEQLVRTKIVLITDAVGLDRAEVKRGLQIMDVNNGEVWAKLDAGTESYFKLVNRSTVRFDRILQNLLETAQARPIVIQSLFLNVHGQAMLAAELDAYCVRLNEILREGGHIKEVHAYTIARPTPEAFATRLERDALEQIAARIRAVTGVRVLVFE